MSIEKLIFDLTLGDGYITKPKTPNGGCYLSIKHSSKQADYLLFKKNLLESKGIKCSIDMYTDTKGYNIIQLRTTQNQLIRQLRERIYINNTKQLNAELIQKIDALTIALLFQDDGTYELTKYHRTPNKGKYKVIPYVNAFVFHTCSFSKEANILLAERFKDFGIEARCISRNKYNCVIISKKKSKQIFVELIKPYICKSMFYKIQHPTNFVGI